jgi:D-amino-acid oxidase
MPDIRISVVGAGVIGLTCAVRLAEAGYPVDVLARDLPLETTSAVAGGLWTPYLAEPAQAVAGWARTTFAELARLSTVPGTGVRMQRGHFLGPARPDWAAALADVAPMHATVDPAPGHRSGWTAQLPLVDMTAYLPWLVERLQAAGGSLTRLPLVALPSRGLVVNCTGVAARALAADPAVRPVRGQVAWLTDPGLSEWFVTTGGEQTTYVLPHPGRVVVGGTAQDGDFNPVPDDADAEHILARARALVPKLADAQVISHRVGLRPARPEVRLETELRPEVTVVHCYGHGGSGVTLSWGCADDVLAEVEAVKSGSYQRVTREI